MKDCIPASQLYFFSVLLIFCFSGCKPDLSDDAIPYQPFGSVTLNINLPEFQELRTFGVMEYNDDVGVRGIIIYRVNANTYRAYERNCSYQPNEACATVNIDGSKLFLTDPCCNSVFDPATGNPSSGAAWRPLRQYETSFTNSQLTITDVIANGI